MKSFLFIFLFYFFLGKVQVKSSDIQVGDLIIVEKVLNYIVTVVNNVYFVSINQMTIFTRFNAMAGNGQRYSIRQ